MKQLLGWASQILTQVINLKEVLSSEGKVPWLSGGLPPT